MQRDEHLIGAPETEAIIMVSKPLVGIYQMPGELSLQLVSLLICLSPLWDD